MCDDLLGPTLRHQTQILRQGSQGEKEEDLPQGYIGSRPLPLPVLWEHPASTLDHVIPRSRGGSTTWDNLVTSCAPCNTDKGDNLPSEVGLTPRNRPRRPSPVEFLVTSAREVPASWEPYLANGEGLPRAGIA